MCKQMKKQKRGEKGMTEGKKSLLSAVGALTQHFHLSSGNAVSSSRESSETKES